MGLNIKNEEVHDLARKAASQTGKTQTGVIREALEQYLARLPGTSGASRQDRIEGFLAGVDELVSEGVRRRVAAAQQNLYDENGLPR